MGKKKHKKDLEVRDFYSDCNDKFEDLPLSADHDPSEDDISVVDETFENEIQFLHITEKSKENAKRMLCIGATSFMVIGVVGGGLALIWTSPALVKSTVKTILHSL